MRIVYYSSARTGSGHIVLGLSIYNGLVRQGVIKQGGRRKAAADEFIILTCGSFTELAGPFGVTVVPIPAEDENRLSKEAYPESVLYRKLTELDPDILLVDLSWFTLHYFIGELRCKKIFLCRQIEDSAFAIPLREGPLIFDPGSYDRLFAIEPFQSKIDLEQMNPIVIRNREEILPRNRALEGLFGGAEHGSRKNYAADEVSAGKVCLFAFNGRPGEFEEIKRMYDYLENEGYAMVYSTNFQGGLFPAADYFNGIDLIICGAGYNAFWEAMYFEKEAVFVPVKRRFEDQRKRVETCSNYRFTENGADRLAREIVNL